MGRKGYKGICEIGKDIYLINDDGNHIILIIQINIELNSCNISIIAGNKGIEGNYDNDIGKFALLSRPGRIQSDILNRRCYFGSRTYKCIKILHLTENFPITTLPINFSSILPGLELDFNRILIPPSGEKIILFDRKGPYIIVVNEVLTSQPIVQIIHTPQSGLKTPLQAACFPIFSVHSHPIWDSQPHVLDEVVNHVIENGVLPNTIHHSNNNNEQQLQQLQQRDNFFRNKNYSIEKSLKISTNFCFVAAGSRIWLVPIADILGLDLPFHLLPDEIKNKQLNDINEYNSNNNNNNNGDNDSDNTNSNSERKASSEDSFSNFKQLENSKNDEDDDGDNNKDKYNQLANVPENCRVYMDEVLQLNSRVQPCLICKLETISPKFLIHDMVSLTSNTILVLNRHSNRTGVWQITTNTDKFTPWEYNKNESLEEFYTIRYISGKDYLAPHGMVISSSRKYLLVVETGSKESNGTSGGEINMIKINLCNRRNNNQVRVSGNIKLSQHYVDTILNWEENLEILRNEMIYINENNLQAANYNEIYSMNGEEYPDQSNEGWSVTDQTFANVKATKKQLQKMFFG